MFVSGPTGLLLFKKPVKLIYIRYREDPIFVIYSKWNAPMIVCIYMMKRMIAATNVFEKS